LSFVADVFGKRLEVSAVCCKACGVEKEKLGLGKIVPERVEATCDPVGVLYSRYWRNEIAREMDGPADRD